MDSTEKQLKYRDGFTNARQKDIIQDVLITELTQNRKPDGCHVGEKVGIIKNVMLHELRPEEVKDDVDTMRDYSSDTSSVEEVGESDQNDTHVGNILSEDMFESDDDDTDLELDSNEWIEEFDNDVTGKTAYIRRCNELGVIPVSYFMRHVEEARFVMRFHGLGPLGAKAIAKPLQNNSAIEEIDLQGNHIERGAVYIARALRDNVYITELVLSENCIDFIGVRAICRMLCENRYINKLDMSGNALRDSTGGFFCEMLKENRTLHELRLSHNEFEMESAACFREALIYNETLQYLDLSWNHFHEAEGKLIGEGVMENFGLKHFDVHMNGFALEGGAAIGKALAQNRTLIYLDISDNRIPKEAGNALANGLQGNDILEKLKLCKNPLTSDGALTVIKGVEKSESSALVYLDFGDIRVTKEFEILEQTVKERQLGITIVHGGVINSLVEKEMIIKEDFVLAFNRDPMTHLRKYLEKTGLRMIDFFKQLDRDSNMALSKDDFIRGIKQCGIDMSEKQIIDLVNRMDTDGDGQIDYKEFVSENNEHRLTKRKVRKTIALNEKIDAEVDKDNNLSAVTLNRNLERLKQMEL